MKRENLIGIAYCIVHFIIEITSYYVIFSYFKSDYVMMLAFVYDMLAFIPEGFYGFLNDIGIKIHFGYLGMAISGIALIMCALGAASALSIVTVAVGNGMIHVQGAQMTLRTSEGKMFPSALFVAGGAFGVVTGRLLAVNDFPVIFVIILHLLMFIPIFLGDKHKNSIQSGMLTKYSYTDDKKGRYLIIAVAFFVVTLRSYMGYAIPMAWNNDSLTLICLFVSMGVGKAVGGYLIDRIGMKNTVFISTIGSLPFILLGNELMPVSLIGIMMFSMTMAIALGILVSVIQQYPGIAFGITTVGPFLGVLIAGFVHIENFFVNCIAVSVMALISCLALVFVLKKN